VRKAGALDWLVPRAPEPIRDLPSDDPDARALVREGLLVEIWPGIAYARDLDLRPSDRARVVSAHVPGGTVVARSSAVWIHTGHFRPDRLEVLAAGARRRSTPRAVVHSEPVTPTDVVRIGPVDVTTRERTALDVTRWEPDEGRAMAWIGALRALGLDPDALAAVMRRADGRPGIERARRRLSGLT
jgi:hypothetical protein